MRRYSGALDATGVRFGIVVSRFNSIVTDRLLDGAVDTLVRHGAQERDIVVAAVPGSFEIPLAARELATHGGVDAVICLGAVIQGGTSHHLHVAAGAAQGIASLGASCPLPITLGVLTTENLEQALDRAGGRSGNRGGEAALAAVEMVSLLRSLRTAPGRGDD